MTIQYRPSGNLIIAGQAFHTDAPIVNWTEGPKWDATSEYCIRTENDADPRAKCTTDPRTGKDIPYGKLPLGAYTQRYSTRPALRSSKFAGGMHPSLEATRAAIKQFVIHHDGCNSADMCFSVLQNERGLSVHFLIDNDGTIFQTIDLALMAYHASEWNTNSIGVEMCNRGDAKKEEHYYDSGRYGPKRDIVPCKINGNTLLSFAYTPAQMDALTRLSRALVRLLPNLPAEYPQSSPGQQAWGTLPRASTFSFSGYIGHYHLWDQKWDPGPFDFKSFCSKLRGSFCYPVFPRPPKKGLLEDKPLVPEKADNLREDTAELYKANEVHADGGFFPVGPWGEARLWHGGVHLAGKEGDGVFAPFAGRLVAARMGASGTPVGSVNFVLLRHDMTLGHSRVPFYSLYMHLGDEPGPGAVEPPWMTRDGSGWAKAAKAGEVVLLDEPVEAGMRIGRVGKAGPAELAKAQLHVEFFAATELFTDVVGSPWQLIDGTAGGRFCDAPEINTIIDTNHDGMLSRQELSQFYASGGGNQLHYMVTLHVSEWTPEPSWADALRVPKDFKKLKPREIDELVAEQITPGLWWTPEVAAHCKLPTDGVVYHYHPVSFLGWFNQLLLDAAAAAGKNPQADASQATVVPTGITDDRGDINGTSMRSSVDGDADPCNGQLTLQDMVRGFDAPACGTP